MESISTITPLYKLGSFLAIMSYYDYAHVWATLWRRLNKKMRDNLKKWENALNENCKRIIVTITDKNAHVMEKHWKFRCLKYFDLDLELRSRAVVKWFVDLLKYFEDLKQKDIEIFEKLCQEDDKVSKYRSYYVPNNYISISRINTVPLKNNSEVVPLLQSLCPKVFDDPVNFLPNWIKILRKDYNNDDEEFWNTSCPVEIEYALKYNKNYDMLDIQLENAGAHLVLKNDKLIATRLSIQSEVEVTEEDAEVLWGNPTHQQNLEYLHLMAPQDMGKFASKFVESCKDLAHLKEVALKYSFDDLELLFQHHIALKGHNIKLLAVNQTAPFRMECSPEKKLFGLDNSDRELLESEEKSHFEMTIKGYCQIYLGSDWFRLNTSNSIRIAGTECTNDHDHAYLSLDGLLELDTQSNIDKEVFHESSSCGLSSIKYVKVPLTCISSVSFVFGGEDFSSEVAPFIKLSYTLSTTNPATQWVLRVNKEPSEPSSKKIEYLHCLKGSKWNDSVLDSLSDDIKLSLKTLNCDFVEISSDKLIDKVIGCNNLHLFCSRISFSYHSTKTNFSKEKIKLDEVLIVLSSSLPNLEYSKMIIQGYYDAKDNQRLKELIEDILGRNHNLRYFYYKSMHCKMNPNFHPASIDNPFWSKYVEFRT